ncbi:MAG: tRNA 2-selenouridine(34) synthase MnmH [Bacteroidota bacterium]
MSILLEAEEFLQQAKLLPIIDVRSPAEWESGHIPGAINIPIFTNDERAKVGTRYKQSGKEQAIEMGLEFVGPKMLQFVKEAKKIAKDKRVLLHCWRGGMRSKSMAWLFELAGLETIILKGGYKAYRNYIREQFNKPANLIVLGGFTGSGKTDILKEIEKLGQQFLDIESIAHHKGSAFGTIGQIQQPTNEQFENNLAEVWQKIDFSKPVWIEDESRSLGKVGIPDPLFKQMRSAKLWRIIVPKKLRIERLVAEYAIVEKAELLVVVNKIERKLGGQDAKKCIEAIENSDFHQVADLTLNYYDKGYAHGNSKRDPESIVDIIIEDDKPVNTAKLLLKKVL